MKSVERSYDELADNMLLTADEAMDFAKDALKAAFIGNLACTPRADDLLTHAFSLRTLSTNLYHHEIADVDNVSD
jgi:hypothetical protein